jgi:hypothetical protein
METLYTPAVDVAATVVLVKFTKVDEIVFQLGAEVPLLVHT